MKLAVVSGAVLAALGAGGLAGHVLAAGPGAAPVADESTSQSAGESRAKAKDAKHAAQRAFVTAKQEWTACVAEAAPGREAETFPFDPEVACGTKPHPHDVGKAVGGRAHDLGPGKPRWAGGPERRTAEPPGLMKRDEARPRG